MIRAVDLAGKLQLRPEASVAVRGAPADLVATIVGDRSQAEASVAEALVAFVRDAGELKETAPLLVDATQRAALTWVAYPKGGQLGTDLNRDVVRETLAPQGAQTVRQVALDDVWSALRLRAG
jgi:hypothetical protein